MEELIFFADRGFEEYLRAIGYKNVQATSRKIYLVNGLGKQVKIDPDNDTITLLNKRGFVVDKSDEFTISRIINFSQNE